VVINEEMIVDSHIKRKHYSLQEVIAYASWEEQLHPGEVFGSGTISDCTRLRMASCLTKEN